MRIFFSILLSISFLNSFSQGDSVEHKFTIGVAPFLFFTPTNDVLYLEYQPKNKFSFELAGGFYNSSIPRFNNAITSGFTVRSAIKFYNYYTMTDFIPYYEILCSYRQVQYKDRFYGEGVDTDPIFEQDYFHLGGDFRHSKTGDEVKQVICLESLWGRKYFLGKREHWVFEQFAGFGVRIKLRDIAIKYEQNYTTWKNVSYKEKTNSILASVHLGIKFGYSF